MNNCLDSGAATSSEWAQKWIKLKSRTVVLEKI